MNKDENQENNVIDLNSKKQENVEDQQNLQQPEMPTHIQGNCGRCGWKLSLPFPVIPVLNHQVVSTVIVPHSKGIECIKCGTYHNIYIVAYNLQLAIVPMERLPQNNEESRIIPYHGKLPGPQ